MGKLERCRAEAGAANNVNGAEEGRGVEQRGYGCEEKGKGERANAATACNPQVVGMLAEEVQLVLTGSAD